MRRQIGKLTALAVKRTKAPGMYGDGGGLWLQITSTGVRSWVFRYARQGRERKMGLGPLHTITLAEARVAATELRKKLLADVDPVDDKRERKAAAVLAAANVEPFATCAARYIEAHKPGWKNAKHAAQWQATLNTYADPVIGTLAVGEVDTAHVLKIIEPIWATKTETARRVRSRLEMVLDWAKARGYRSGDNPARWAGHLQNLLPLPSKIRRVEHFAALPYLEVGAFVSTLRKDENTAAAALELLILTNTRTSETINAQWPEVDLQAKVWTIPAVRMKAGKEYRVPLSDAAVLVFSRMQKLGNVGFVFPGDNPGRPLSNMAMLALLKRMGRDNITVHGFRSTFRDWAAECTSYPREVAEMCLAHSIGDKTEAAYRRGDLFEKRRRLMDAWAKYCDRIQTAAPGSVVTLARA